jgi:pimeloyl-ACP methyl ester carboxylesterase
MLHTLSRVDEIVQITRAQEDDLPLMDEGCRSQFLLQPMPTDRVCLFFHGFTATPAQFARIGREFFQMGYNVLIPLLPGHGLAGEWDRDRPPPLPEDQQVYREFGEYWLQQASAFGNRIVIGGLSGGSTLAAWLTLKHAALIERALLFAPYLSGTNWLVDWCVRSLDIYFAWKPAPGVTSFGYPGFAMPSLRLFLDIGQEVLQQAEQKCVAPLLIVSSERDQAVGRDEHLTLFESALRQQPMSWHHCFDAEWGIGHNMMTEVEGNAVADLVIAIARAFVESDLTWTEVQAIRNRIASGKSFQRAITELNLKQRTSPDLLTLVTM